jgi:phage-related baseplate assembly protein
MSPQAGRVNVYFTQIGGVLPTADTVAGVQSYVADPARRAMSDLVTVAAPTPATFTVDLTYFIADDDSARATEIQAAVTDAVTAWISWQRAQIGRDINPSELIRRVMNAGAYRVQVASPTYQQLTMAQLAVLSGSARVVYGGIADE